MTGIGESSYRRYLANNQETLEMLIRSYSDALVRYAYCYVGSAAAAEDIMEDAFVAYIVKKVEFQSKEQLRAWLYRTVRNKAVDYLRRHRREVALSDVENVLCTPDASQDLMIRQRNESIYICMQRLPGSTGRCSSWRIWTGLPSTRSARSWERAISRCIISCPAPKQP